MSFIDKLKAFVFSKYFLKQLGWIALVYVVIVGGTIVYLDYYTHHGEKIEVPNLVGKNVNNVKSEIEDLDLTYEILDSIYDPSKPVGTILDQDPDPTALSQVYVKEGRIIRVRVSKNTRLIEMPSLVDKSQRFAVSILENRGLRYKIQYEPTNEANGAVLRQLYKGAPVSDGARIPIGSTITLVVGKNDAAAPVQVPDLMGMTISEAKLRLSGAGSFGFMMVCEDCASSEDSLNARVISQSPEYIEGVLIPAGTTVTVYATKN